MEVIKDDYIRKIEAVNILQKAYTEGRIKAKDGCVSVLDDINALPKADVQPVKHGRWIDCTFYDPYEKSWEQNYEFKCSNCGHRIYNKPNDNNLFCGHCSAKMDLKDGKKE